MSKFSILLYGITFSSVILASQVYQNDHQTIAADNETSNLALVANGEDFVRQGFVSKDGWEISFDRVFVNISDAIAYSTESAFEPQKGDTKSSISYQQKVDFIDGDRITDLAAGDGDAEPIVVSETSVPVGFYNALSWKLTTAQPDSEIAGNTIRVKKAEAPDTSDIGKTKTAN